MPNKTTPDDDWLDNALIVGFLYGIQSDSLSDDEVIHRVAGFKHTKGFAEAKAAINAKITELLVAELEDIANHYYHAEPNLLKAREALAIGLFDSIRQLQASQPINVEVDNG